MSYPDHPVDDVFLPNGRLRFEVMSDAARRAFEEAVQFARQTRWESLRSPHVFMGLLAVPDCGVRNWGERLGADLSRLLQQFREIFHQDQDCEPYLDLTREFFSDNVIRLLREAYERARRHGRSKLTCMDLLISLLTANNSIVAECFERIGVTAAKLTELAVMAEHHSSQG